MSPHYNVAPSQVMPVVVQHSPNSVELMKWGLVPFWAKDPKIGYKTINARAETLASSPAYREAFKRRRCLVPASGFYEWKAAPEGKIPHYITLKEGGLFSFAGLYEVWKDPQGKELTTYTIITTVPNALMESIHNRMPVILHQADEDTWLNPDFFETKELERLLVPYPENEMQAWPVSRDVNSPRNDSEALIKPVAS